MSLALRPARVTRPPAQGTGPAQATGPASPAGSPEPASAPLPSAEAGPALGPSLLGLGLGARLAMAAMALACLWSAVALGMS